MIAGSRPGFTVQSDTGNFTLLHVVEPHAPNNRLNDGFVDSQGYLGSARWTTTKKNRAARSTSSRLGMQSPRPGYVVTNGPAESPDGRVLYHTDTLAGIIYAFDRSREGLSNKRVFARFSAGDGYPDGPIVDVEGCLWTGVFGGWGLRRYSPKGELLSTLRLPCSAVTKAAFGGDDLRTLYITTAHVALDAEQRKQQPWRAACFA
jgi:sugar lactone lactonase YvrE